MAVEWGGTAAGEENYYWLVMIGSVLFIAAGGLGYMATEAKSGDKKSKYDQWFLLTVVGLVVMGIGYIIVISKLIGLRNDIKDTCGSLGDFGDVCDALLEPYTDAIVEGIVQLIILLGIACGITFFVNKAKGKASGGGRGRK